MSGFEEFEHHLQEALSGLYDPARWPAEGVWSVLGVDGHDGIEGLWRALVEAIGEMEPDPDVPAAARMRRVYDLLRYRYVQSLTQDAASERLGITPRHLRREQREAVHLLAQRLWTRSKQAEREEAADEARGGRPGASTDDYLSQVRQELMSLRERARESSADVGAVFAKVVDFVRELASKHNVLVEVEEVASALTAAIHPSALRQMLITAVHEAAEAMGTGQITMSAGREGACVRILLEAWPVADQSPPDTRFIDEILSWSGGSARGEVDGDRLRFSLLVPAADPTRVLVLDDNEDMTHFFRRYVAGTRYTLTVAEGAHAFLGLVEQIAPDIIVLDVMLPDVDGWDVLMHLNTRPETSDIPVVVCSVVRERELALSLGAAVYLPKPVRRQDFIQALDEALAQAVAGVERRPASTPTPC